MVCPDCTYSECVAMDCYKVKALQMELAHVIHPSNNFKLISQNKNTGTGSNLAVAAAECKKGDF